MKKLLALTLICGIALNSGLSVEAAGLKDVFNAKYYADQYPDLYDAFGYNETLLYRHFLKYGLKEGRVMNPVIDIVKYRDSYQDLDNAFGNNWDAYVQHYIEYGIKEKRDNGTDFDPIAYVESYSDIEEAFGDDFTAIIDHYQEYGMKEERKEASKVYQEEKKQIEAAKKPPVVAPPVVEKPAEKYEVLKDENGNVYDLGGMEIVIRNWWSSGLSFDPNNAYEMAKKEYLEWAQDTYNFTIDMIAISDWASAPQDFVDYVVAGGDESNYIFTLRDDPMTQVAIKNEYMYDLSTLDILDFTESKFQMNKLYQQYSKDGRINAMAAGYSEPRCGMFFNKRLLKEAGIDPESIYDMQANGTWTWDAWTNIMEKVQRDIDGDGTIDVYGFDANYGIPTMQAVYSNNAEFVGLDAQGDYTYEVESPETLEALEWINDVIVEYAMDRPNDAQWDYYKTSFTEGEVAFCPDEAYMATKNMPFYNMEDEIGYVQFPKGPQAASYTNCWTNNALVIPACYDDEKAWKIAFAWDVFTADIPGYEGYADITGYSDGNFDARAISETIPSMMKNGMITYHSMVPGLDMGKGFLWEFNPDGVDVSEILDGVRDTYKEKINEAN